MDSPAHNPHTGSESPPVKRRRILYAHGFDPASSSRYQRLITRAGRGRGGAEAEIGGIEQTSAFSDGWLMARDGDAGEEGIETVFEILRYEDVIRRFRGRARPLALLSGLFSWLRFVLLGGLYRTARYARGPVLLYFQPVMMLFAFVGTGIFLGRLGGEAAELAGAPDFASQIGRAIGALIGLGLSYRLERVFFSHLMLALFEFLGRMAHARAPMAEMNERITAFADLILERINAAEEEEVDEILIVGHSLGGYVAARALSEALSRMPDLGEGRATISFLTLGSVAGYIACTGGAGARVFEADIDRIAAARALFWVDVSAPRDWFSFALVDPLRFVRHLSEAARSPRVISAKFGRFRPDPEDKRTKFPAMGMHMRYLAAPDRSGGFDFFALLMEPKTLQARYERRRNSPKARIIRL